MVPVSASNSSPDHALSADFAHVYIDHRYISSRTRCSVSGTDLSRNEWLQSPARQIGCGFIPGTPREPSLHRERPLIIKSRLFQRLRVGLISNTQRHRASLVRVFTFSVCNILQFACSNSEALHVACGRDLSTVIYLYASLYYSYSFQGCETYLSHPLTSSQILTVMFNPRRDALAQWDLEEKLSGKSDSVHERRR